VNLRVCVAKNYIYTLRATCQLVINVFNLELLNFVDCHLILCKKKVLSKFGLLAFMVFCFRFLKIWLEVVDCYIVLRPGNHTNLKKFVEKYKMKTLYTRSNITGIKNVLVLLTKLTLFHFTTIYQ
jgi:hypothetical protein